MHLQFGAGDRLGDVDGGCPVQHVVVAAVEDERGRGHRPQGVEALGRAREGRPLPGEALRVVAAVVGLAGRAHVPLDLVVEASDRCGLEGCARERHRLLARDAHGRLGELGALAVRDPAARLAGNGRQQPEAEDALGVVDREHLRHHAAHRVPGDVRLLDAQIVEHAQHVLGQIDEVVAAVDVVGPAEELRETGVAVVEAHHPQAAGGEDADELLVPAEQLGAAARDEHEHGGVGGGVGPGEHLVVQAHIGGIGVGHAYSSRSGTRGPRSG